MIVRAVRIVLICLGIWCAWYGLTLLLETGIPELRSIGIWFAGGILLHDGVFAPLSIAIGLSGRWWLPRAWWAPAACGAVCTVALLALAAPVIRREGAIADNPTVLDRNYAAGLTIALVVVWTLVAAVILRRTRQSHTE